MTVDDDFCAHKKGLALLLFFSLGGLLYKSSYLQFKKLNQVGKHRQIYISIKYKQAQYGGVQETYLFHF